MSRKNQLKKRGVPTEWSPRQNLHPTHGKLRNLRSDRGRKTLGHKKQSRNQEVDSRFPISHKFLGPLYLPGTDRIIQKFHAKNADGATHLQGVFVVCPRSYTWALSFVFLWVLCLKRAEEQCSADLVAGWLFVKFNERWIQEANVIIGSIPISGLSFMYNLPYHKEQNAQVIKEFVDQHPFAFVTGCDSKNKPVATQVPVFIEERDGKKVLRGHIMKNTDHHKAFLHNENVLVVFTGHHIYVSATWYSDPHMASTWNYMSVHVKGIIRFLDDAALEDVLRKTTLHFENYDRQSTTVFDNLPAEFKRKVMKAIVAFEIEIEEMDNVFKLSQDRDSKSYHNIIERVKQQGEDGRVIAAEMARRTEELFPGNKKQG